MGKNKAKGLKQANVFHIANKKILKAKSKTKPVATNLKKIPMSQEDKLANVDAAAHLLSQL
uniref:Ribosomal biogenesis factor n=1 Tax=Naja naja TaxID=35670 RepID=A0A8C7E288_NAJNA